MPKLDISGLRQPLQDFEFRRLFNALGWSQPGRVRPQPFNVQETAYTEEPIAQLGGVVVVEITLADGQLPSQDKRLRQAIHKQVMQRARENLIIFVDRDRTQSLWVWARVEGSRSELREHYYFRQQPGDLLLSKLSAVFFDLGELDEEGNVSVVEVAERLKRAFDVETVTKKFYAGYKEQRERLIDAIQGIDNERDREWYASVLLNRLMFAYFLQRKGFLDGGNLDYLHAKLAESRRRGPDRYYGEFLQTLFFQGFAAPQPTVEARALLGAIKYLDGGLFLEHPIEQRWPHIHIPDAALARVLELFRQYSWNLNDTPGADDDELNPDVLGYIFEKYINQKAFGAYYTRTEITEYLCQQTIHRLVLDHVNLAAVPGRPARHFDSVDEMIMRLDARLCRDLLDYLPRLSLLDPACGSGAFLVAAMKTLLQIYGAVIGKIEFLNDANLRKWKRDAQREHPNLDYWVRKKIITDNLYGVDIMEEAVEIAKLRLFLALVATAHSVDELEPLPHIDFNILPGNSLVGLLRVNADRYGKQLGLYSRSYDDIVQEKNRLVSSYRGTTEFQAAGALQALRDEIETKRGAANQALGQILLDDFVQLGVKFEQATWDAHKGSEGKPVKRALTLDDIAELRPFHWGFEFDTILNERGGFDAIITNPPWEIFKPNAKEFFQDYSDLITKNKMRIEEFESAKGGLLQDQALRAAWLDYLSRFPHQSAFFRAVPQYVNQIAVVNGKKAGTDINLYKLFLEQCYNLLRPGGQCGIVIPSGIYTDLGTKQLRQMLFDTARVTGLFCFENRRMIFEGVDSRFKFVVLTFEKGGQTQSFPAAFMRHAVADLARFPRDGAIDIPVELVRRLSPDSLSIMEFKTPLDIHIAEKMLAFPLLGETREGTWNVRLTREFDMTNDSHLFKTAPAPGRLPLYEGKLIHQFDHRFSAPRYWVDEREGRKALLGKEKDNNQKLDYQEYRLGIRAIGRNTDMRTLIAGPIPKHAFCGNSVLVSTALDGPTLTFAQALLNSMVVDVYIRQMVSANLNMFFIYQLPIPRLTETDPRFRPIVERAARLVCTTPEFDALARAVGLQGHADGAADPAERARLRAELDGLVAHLYGLTEAEFSHILGQFPLVAPAVTDAALQAYHALAPLAGDAEIAALIARGESDRLEFKSTARWNLREGKKDAEMERVIVKTVAAFLNSDGGDLLIGVADDGSLVGLDDDLQTLGQRATLDGLEQTLTQLLWNGVGAARADQVRLTFHALGGKTVCRVQVEPSPEPVWLKEGGAEVFYIRANNTSRALTGREMVSYIQHHWR